jgi:hypothetical protein
MEQDMEYRRQLVERYKKDVEPLFRYLPWLIEKKGNKVSNQYTNNDLEHTIAFPVYDSTLLGFVREVQRSSLTDRNYVYVYSRYRVKTAEDEHKLIKGVTIKNIEVLTAVLSKYIIGGMTKGWMWSQAVEDGIFLEVLEKFKELFELWNQPSYSYKEGMGV